MTIESIAIDKDQVIQKAMEEYSTKLEHFSLLNSFSGTGGAKRFLLQYPVDLIFLDLADGNSLEWYEGLSPKPMLICLASHSQNAVDAFNMDAVDYLVKPLEEGRFIKAIQKALTAMRIKLSMNESSQPYIFVHSEYQLVKVLFKDIHYIVAKDDLVKICRQGKPPVFANMTMRHLADNLPPWKFVRIHRSYIVPRDKICRFDYNHVFLGDTAFPIGVTFREAITRSIFSKQPL